MLPLNKRQDSANCCVACHVRQKENNNSNIFTGGKLATRDFLGDRKS